MKRNSLNIIFSFTPRLFYYFYYLYSLQNILLSFKDKKKKTMTSKNVSQKTAQFLRKKIGENGIFKRGVSREKNFSGSVFSF